MHALRIINKDGQAPTAEEITAANKVATTFKAATIGTFKVIDPIDDIEVEYHAHKALAFTQGGSSIYFGFSAQVEMRCWCRGVVLAETKAAAQPTVSYESTYVSPGTDSVTATLYDSVGGIAGTVTGTRTQIPGYYAYDNMFIDVVTNNVQAYTPLPDRWQIHTGSGTGVFTGIGSWIPVSPSYESLLAAAQAAANQRSAVFLTDGTELGSAPTNTPISDPNIPNDDWQYNRLGSTTWRGDGSAPLFDVDGSNGTWNRVSDLTFTVPDDVCYQKVDAPSYPGSPPISINYNPPQLNFPIIAEVIVGTTGITISESHMFATSNATLDGNTITGTKSITLGAPNGIVSHELVTFREIPHYSSYTTTFNNYAIDSTHIISGTYYQESTENGGSGITIDNTVISINPLYDNIQKQWITDWNAAQAVALTREHARRKKCSDGQLAYLRNGFLSPEFEYFIKTQHPVSALVRRDIPMEIISGPTYTLLNDPGVELPRFYQYEGTVTIKYVANDSNGNPVQHIKTLSGSATLTENRTNSTDGNPSGPNWHVYTYTDFPILSSQTPNSGDTYYPNTRALGLYPINFHINDPAYLMSGLIIGDDNVLGSSILSVLNGNWTTNRLWNPTNQWFDELGTAASYSPGYDAPPTSATLKYTHPQFLLDYIAASKPIETEIDENGNKVPVTPSTDWLSSRLTDKEVIKVIPLNHVGNSYGNYGMFPLMQRDAEDNLIVNELRIYGYAEFQYSAETTSFTFKKWVELIDDGKLTILADDEVLLDDDLNPTTISVTNSSETKTYSLAPKSFDYDEEWGATNCVCVGNKAIWSDVKADAKEQKKNISNNTPEGHELTAEEKLYKAVREAIA